MDAFGWPDTWTWFDEIAWQLRITDDREERAQHLAYYADKYGWCRETLAAAVVGDDAC